MSRESAPPILLLLPGSKLLYLRIGRHYETVDERLLRNELARHHPSVRLRRETEGGDSKRVSTRELVERYGVRVDDIAFSLAASADQFEPNNRGGGTLVKACATLDPHLEPKFDPDVNEWLELFAGKAKFGYLQDWIACVPRLGRPTLGLALIGPPGPGKSLIGDGSARLYGNQATEFSSVCGKDFNAQLRSNPIVVANETLGSGRHNAAFVRSLISEGRRTLNEKYRPTTTLRGHPRLIATLNNPDGLRLGDSRTAHDDQALSQRFLVVRARTEAKVWLEQKGSRAFTADWIDSDGKPGRLVNHFRWLTLNHTVKNPGGRFLVAPGEGWEDLTTEREGPTNQVLIAIAVLVSSRLTKPRKDGRIAVATDAVWLKANELATNREGLSVNAVGRQLSMLSGRQQTRPGKDGDGNRPYLWLIPATRVAAAAQLVGVGDYDHLITLL